MQCHDAFRGSSRVTWFVTAACETALRSRDRASSTAACSADRTLQSRVVLPGTRTGCA
ncbi:NolM protein [Bradyrhizobium diazoefficiens]|uniref:NolM protein n=1 Tax=Bradyrhizobium diazoefficiens TaxID=1355477 RepID=A0A0E4BRA0_9BRAD|nr:NolM protein [Bradyrhizobium diazoefficiens]